MMGSVRLMLLPISYFMKAAGRNSGSFWTKSYGMMAALRFVIEYLHYWNITPLTPRDQTL
jgi:hypothetical protein